MIMSKDKDTKKQAEEAAKEEKASTKEEKKVAGQESKEDRKAGKEEKKIDEKQAQIDALNDKLSKEHDDYLRLMAEFQTFRSRSAEDRLSLLSNASADVIKGLLPVLDDCERALGMLEKETNSVAKEGTLLIYNKLMDYLKGKGLEAIEAKGKDFDTDFHDAVTKFPAPSPDMKGKVIDVIQTGYLLNGKILRYAKVVVGE